MLIQFCGDPHDYKVNVGEAKAITISQKSRADNLNDLVEKANGHQAKPETSREGKTWALLCESETF